MIFLAALVWWFLALLLTGRPGPKIQRAASMVKSQPPILLSSVMQNMANLAKYNNFEFNAFEICNSFFYYFFCCLTSHTYIASDIIRYMASDVEISRQTFLHRHIEMLTAMNI